MTTNEWDLSPGQREDMAQDSRREMQARVHMWHEDTNQINSQDSCATQDSIDLWQARNRSKTGQLQPQTDIEQNRTQRGHVVAPAFHTWKKRVPIDNY